MATTALVTWKSFQDELAARERELVSQLPSTVKWERFRNSAIAAVKQTPDLLKAEMRSLFAAITKSAQDGLLPDGREGVILVFRDKQKDNSWLQVAQWLPMTWGLRKRARELDQLIVTAQVIHANDHFLQIEGDTPRLEHHPAPLGHARGSMIGAYAIVRQGEIILHREVMHKSEIEAVRSQSKNQNGLLWTTFEGEAWRKTVTKRALKTVPCSEKLETIVRRDDDHFDFTEATPDTPRIVQGGRRPLPPVVGEIPTASMTPEESKAIDLELAAQEKQSS